MFGRLRLAAPVLLLALIGSAQAQISKKGGAWQFRAKYVKGSTLKFDFVTDVVTLGAGANAPKQKITLPLLMRVLDIQNGVSKIRSEAGPILLNGKPFRPKTTVTVHVDSLNRLVGEASEIPQFTTPLPENPIKIGQSWSAKIDPTGSVPMPMTVLAKYKLVKIDSNYAHIAVSLSGKGTGGTAVTTTGQGTMVLRRKDGTMQSTRMTQTVKLSQGAGATSTIVVRRLG